MKLQLYSWHRECSCERRRKERLRSCRYGKEIANIVLRIRHEMFNLSGFYIYSTLCARMIQYWSNVLHTPLHRDATLMLTLMYIIVLDVVYGE